MVISPSRSLYLSMEKRYCYFCPRQHPQQDSTKKHKYVSPIECINFEISGCRYVFTLEDKDVVAPAFEFFFEGLEALTETTPDTEAQFHYQEIPVDFPQYFTYNRTNELVSFQAALYILI